MKHLGDITKISGYDAPVVDCVIGGSPCQDLSIAGKRAGLDGERSGLFMEQLRIIKEMIDNDRKSGRAGVDVRPRFMVWENVVGSLSSKRGEDFRAVLEETAKVAEKDAYIPMPSDGKWRTSGCIVGNGWSIAWRVLDAQFWGVPQRRRRIALVADFGGHSAPEILFVRKSVSGDSEPNKPQGKETSSDATGSVGTDDRYGEGFDGFNGELTGGVSATIGVNCGMSTGRNGVVVPYTLKIRSGCEGGGKGALMQTDKSATLSTLQDQTLFQPVVFDARGNGDGKTVCTITVDHCNRVTDYTPVLAIDQGGGKSACGVVALDRASFNQGINALQSVAGHSLNGNNVVRTKYIVRRLTPMECERLQGYPDGWTDIGEWTDSNGKVRKTSDAARYKALGNSIALPPWKWVLKRLCACYERDATMASLFDGIGGFPLIWEGLNGKGTCLWASEIEEFPIAVTKKRLGGD